MAVQTPVNDIYNIMDRINRAGGWTFRGYRALSNPDVIMMSSFQVVQKCQRHDSGIPGFLFPRHNSEYTETNLEVETVGNLASATFTFKMLYEREGVAIDQRGAICGCSSSSRKNGWRPGGPCWMFMKRR